MKAQKKPEESRSSVPTYIVTFSDMVTLLLTFFVLLLSLADEQDESRFQRGQDSFKRAIADFGLSGILFNKDISTQFDHPKVKYKMDKGEDEPENLSIDLATETYRRIIEEVEQLMKIMPSQITCAEKTFFVTDITFDRGSWTLNAGARSFLDNYVEQLEASFAGDRPVLYVVGLAAEEPEARQQWLVSARRAAAVADYARQILSGELHWTVYSWGAGAGGVWTGQQGMFSRQTHIAIAVLTDDKEAGG